MKNKKKYSTALAHEDETINVLVWYLLVGLLACTVKQKYKLENVQIIKFECEKIYKIKKQ